MKLLKHLQMLIRGDSTARIGDCNDHLFATAQMGLHPNLPALRSEFERVMDEVMQHLLQPVSVRSDRDRDEIRRANSDGFTFSDRFKIPQHVPDHLGSRHGVEIQRHFPRLYP